MSATMIEVNGITLRCLVEGAGEPLVLIHGVGSSLEAWDGVAARLRDRYPHRAIRPARPRPVRKGTGALHGRGFFR
jgi:pimeloyl-ACP methyl ester carboxylesterase